MGGALRRGGGLVAAFAVLALPASTGARSVAYPPAREVPPGYHGPEVGLPTEYPDPARTGRPCTIGFQNPDAQSPKFWFVQLAVVRKGSAFGCRVIALDDALNAGKQVSNMKLLLAQKVGAIIFYPLSASAATPVLQQAEAANVPVVGIDASFGVKRIVPLIATQVWDGLDIQAFLQARELAKARRRANLGLIGLGPPVPAINYLESREKHWATTIGHATFRGSRPNPTGHVAGGEQAAQVLLAQHGSIDAVVAYNEDSAIGTLGASAGRQLAVIGNDGSPVGIGTVGPHGLTATVEADPVGIGVQAATAAYSLITRQHLPLPDVVLRPARVWHPCTNCGGPVSWLTLLLGVG